MPIGFKNRKQLEESLGPLGCFHCYKILHVSEIEEWTDENMTALCPHCGVDAVTYFSEALRSIGKVRFAVKGKNDH